MNTVSGTEAEATETGENEFFLSLWGTWKRKAWPFTQNLDGRSQKVWTWKKAVGAGQEQRCSRQSLTSQELEAEHLGSLANPGGFQIVVC